MQTIHLVALDMDGTLLDGQKKVSPRTLQALRTLKEKGIPAAFATGRPLAEVVIYPELMGLVPYGVLTSGAMVMHMDSGKIIREDTIPLPAALSALRLARQEDVVPHLMTRRHSVCLAEDIEKMADHHMAVYTPMYRAVCVKPSSMEDYLISHGDELLKFNFYHTSIQARERSERRMKELPLQLVHAEYSSLECTAPGVAKDEGIRRLCAYLGTTAEHALALGDSDNDTAMLKACGASVAMGNAPESVQSAARFVTDDNDHDGAAAAIERFLPFMAPVNGGQKDA